MTTEVLAIGQRRAAAPVTRAGGRRDVLPIATVASVLLVLWYVAAVIANWTGAAEALARKGEPDTASAVLPATLSLTRPLLPAPHQIVQELAHSTLAVPLASPRNLLYHAGITLSATLVGFAIGAALGIAIAIAIVHLRSVERSLMPWVVASQTVPILAVAPIVIVALGAIGLTGLLPKAIIAAYLCFFPVTVGMVKGLKAPDRQLRDLMRTYCASAPRTLWHLRLPASLPYLFVALKISITASLVGTIVGELPTGAQGGLGARLLAGSYYGQTIQIWAALVLAAVLAAALVAGVSAVEATCLRRMGARPQ